MKIDEFTLCLTVHWYKLLAVYLITFSHLHRQTSSEPLNGKKCITNTKKPGHCILVTECSNYEELLVDSDSIPVTCGESFGVPIICCPSKEDSPRVEDNPSLKQVAAGLIENCGTRRKDFASGVGGKIIYGTKCKDGEFPWNVAMFQGSEVVCGGTIISDRYILTASHCFDEIGTSGWSIGVGSVYTDLVEKYPIEWIKKHPDYHDPQFYSDIALMRTSKPIKFSETVRPICLPNDFDMAQYIIKNHLNVTVTGWGITEKKVSSNVLLKANLNINARSECNEAYSKKTYRRKHYPNGITDDFICAASTDYKQDSCRGDSGGPLIVKLKESDANKIPNWESGFTLVGVVSFGAGCAQRGFPGVYIDVAKYAPWIRDYVSFETSSVPDFKDTR